MGDTRPVYGDERAWSSYPSLTFAINERFARHCGWDFRYEQYQIAEMPWGKLEAYSTAAMQHLVGSNPDIESAQTWIVGVVGGNGHLHASRENGLARFGGDAACVGDIGPNQHDAASVAACASWACECGTCLNNDITVLAGGRRWPGIEILGAIGSAKHLDA